MLARMLAGVRAGAPIAHGPLTVVPLLVGDVAEPDWLTLAEAGDEVTITEVDERGDVPALKVENRAPRALLLLDGEELVGALQNRALDATVLVGAGRTVTIPVSCVEQGRWAWRSAAFSPGGTSLFASLRRAKAAAVARSLRRGRGHGGSQREIWAGIASRVAQHGIESPTLAMHAMYERFASVLESARRALAARPRQAGALVYVAGRWVGLDLLAAPGVFARVWPRLLAGYAADAVGVPASRALEPPPDDVIERVAAAPLDPVPAVALGVEHRLGGDVAGAALVHEERLVHLMAFPAPSAG